MTNIFGSDGKGSMKDRLFQIGVETLEKDGWTIERIKMGKGSVRRITKGKESLIVSIRTTQDTYIAFPRTGDDSKWVTLSDVDRVVAVSVDDKENPKFANVHMLDGDDMRKRFDRAYAARKKAGRSIPLGRGMWLALYEQDSPSPVHHVGAGAGRDKHTFMAEVPLGIKPTPPESIDEFEYVDNEEPLTIAEAKRRLALAFGVEPSSVKITVEG